MRFVFAKIQILLLAVLTPTYCIPAAQASEPAQPTPSMSASSELQPIRSASLSKPQALPRDTRVRRVVDSLDQLAAPLPSLRPSIDSRDIAPGDSTGPVLQLGAFHNEDGAHTASKEFDSRHGSVRGLTTSIQKVDLGAKGVWYRVHVGPFADRAVATTACAELKVEGTNCIVTVVP